MISFLQISVSLIFFANKVAVLVEKKVGWIFGVIAALLAFFYFYLLGMYIYTVLELGLIVLMGYGFFKKQKKNPQVEVMIRVVLAVVMLTLALFAFNGLITIVELVSSLGLLWGTYYLTHEKIRAGWLLYVVGHTTAAYLGINKDQMFFADFQIASAIVSLVGMVKR